MWEGWEDGAEVKRNAVPNDLLSTLFIPRTLPTLPTPPTLKNDKKPALLRFRMSI